MSRLAYLQAKNRAEHKMVGIDVPHFYPLKSGDGWWGAFWHRRTMEGFYWSHQTATLPSRELAWQAVKEWWEDRRDPPTKKELDFGLKHPYCL